MILGAIGPLKKRLPTTNTEDHQIVARPQIHVEIRTILWTALVRLALGKPVCRGRHLMHASLRLRVASCASIASVHSLATFVLVCWMVLGCTGGSGVDSCSRLSSPKSWSGAQWDYTTVTRNAECYSERESQIISLIALVNNNRMQASQAIGCFVASALSAVSDR